MKPVHWLSPPARPTSPCPLRVVALLCEERRQQKEDAISSLAILPFDSSLLDPLHIVAMAAPACGLSRGGLGTRP
jgi:hypothetical protein